MIRYAMTWSATAIAAMRECADGDYVRWGDHIEAVCKLRDKIMEFAKDCSHCDGTGIITVNDEDAPAFGRTLPCYACEDLRELLEE